MYTKKFDLAGTIFAVTGVLLGIILILLLTFELGGGLTLG